jgi:hypothetical protein
LNRIEEKLNPNFVPHGNQDVRQMWPGQPAGGQQMPQNTSWPAQPAQTQPAWPSSTQSQPAANGNDAYSVGPREANQYPYSAEAQRGRDY